MSKRQGLFVFVDTRASTKRLYADPDYFETFVKDTLEFVIRQFSNELLVSDCQFKPLGDGILISYLSQEETLQSDAKFESILRGAIKASFTCIRNFDKEMRGKTPRDTRASRPYCLGVSIGNGFVYDFAYQDKKKTLSVNDIASMDLTYVFRLNKFADPEGVIVSNWLYENYRSLFDEFGTFSPKRKFIDNAFDVKTIYSSKEVEIKDEKGDTTRSYRSLAEYAIAVCRDIIKVEISKNKFPYSAPPEIRFMLFKCDDQKIEEVFNLYPGGLEGAKKDTFEVLPVDRILVENKYPHLIYECYYKKQIVFFAYSHRYIKNKQVYIDESKERFYFDIDASKIDDFFEGLTLKPSSALAIPIFDVKHEKVKWVAALDSIETRVFKERFYDHVGTAVATYYDLELREMLEASDRKEVSSTSAS